MQPTRSRYLHGFDARSLVLFASLTMGGTQAVLAQGLSLPAAVQHHATTPHLQLAQAGGAPTTSTEPTAEQAFDRADANGDGKLTLREAERYPAVSKRFSQFDQDKNGSLSRTEFAQGLKQR